MKAATLVVEKLPSAPTADFSGLAHIYRWLEWLSFGPFLRRCRCAFLSTVNDRRRALVIGDGDGRFTACMLRTNPHLTVDAVDASPAMLDELTARASSHRHLLRTHLADARDFHPPHRDYDLVVTHFFLDCLTTQEVQHLATRLHTSVAPQAAWVISEFAVPAGWYGRAFAGPLVFVLYRIFGWCTGLEIRRLPDHRSALTRSGWSLQQERKWLGGLLVSEIWQPSGK